jgi:two-component system OmpR family response regulator
MARILIVDDEPAVRSLMAVTLKLAGHQIIEAGGGEEGLALIEKRPFDLVVLDIMMPVTDGYEVLGRLRAMKDRAHTPVIVVTAKGFDTNGLMREAAGGAVDHLAKPFDPEELERAVERVLSASEDELERRRKMHSRGAEVFAAISELRAIGGDEGETGRRKRH